MLQKVKNEKKAGVEFSCERSKVHSSIRQGLFETNEKKTKTWNPQ